MKLRYCLLTAFLLGLFVLDLSAQSVSNAIRLNQIGFYPEGLKHVFVVDPPGSTFYLTRPGRTDTVYTGTLTAAKTWTPSGELGAIADFSDYTVPGSYILYVPEVGYSYPFEIQDYVYQPVAEGAIRSFYYQRASTALPKQYAGRWARAAGHLDTKVLIHPSAATEARPAGATISAPKGWYDAGDYNKYIVNSGITTATLMMVYEQFPEYVEHLRLNIPETGNGIPDLLDEVLWNLRWMLAMQDPNDGGVYHKLTEASFSGMVMPVAATAPRYVVQKSTSAALNFAAVMFMAARIYDDFPAELPGLADSCRTAAESAWQWANANPTVYYNQDAMNSAFNPDIFTGAYGDNYVIDEFRWAAGERYVTTGDANSLSKYSPVQENLRYPGWADTGMLGVLSFLTHRKTLVNVDTTLLRNRLTGIADGMVNRWKSSAVRTVMGGENEFWWGSNGVAANMGLILINSYLITGKQDYLDAALSNLDYILGRNGTGYSYVTGYGDNKPMHPHHRPSEGDGIVDPVPGFIVGGPNKDLNDEGSCINRYIGRVPAKAYVDNVCSYATNEVAINWSAPWVYLTVAAEALTSPTGLPTAASPTDDVPVTTENLPARVFPNPSAEEATLEVVLAAPADLQIEIFDLLGRSMGVYNYGLIGAGTKNIDLPIARLASGTYLIRVKAGSVTAAVRLVKI